MNAPALVLCLLLCPLACAQEDPARLLAEIQLRERAWAVAETYFCDSFLSPWGKVLAAESFGAAPGLPFNKALYAEQTKAAKRLGRSITRDESAVLARDLVLDELRRDPEFGARLDAVAADHLAWLIEQNERDLHDWPTAADQYRNRRTVLSPAQARYKARQDDAAGKTAAQTPEPLGKASPFRPVEPGGAPPEPQAIEPGLDAAPANQSAPERPVTTYYLRDGRQLEATLALESEGILSLWLTSGRLVQVPARDVARITPGRAEAPAPEPGAAADAGSVSAPPPAAQGADTQPPTNRQH